MRLATEVVFPFMGEERPVKRRNRTVCGSFPSWLERVVLVQSCVELHGTLCKCWRAVEIASCVECVVPKEAELKDLVLRGNGLMRTLSTLVE